MTFYVPFSRSIYVKVRNSWYFCLGCKVYLLFSFFFVESFISVPLSGNSKPCRCFGARCKVHLYLFLLIVFPAMEFLFSEIVKLDIYLLVPLQTKFERGTNVSMINQVV